MARRPPPDDDPSTASRIVSLSPERVFLESLNSANTARTYLRMTEVFLHRAGDEESVELEGRLDRVLEEIINKATDLRAQIYAYREPRGCCVASGVA